MQVSNAMRCKTRVKRGGKGPQRGMYFEMIGTLIIVGFKTLCASRSVWKMCRATLVLDHPESLNPALLARKPRHNWSSKNENGKPF